MQLVQAYTSYAAKWRPSGSIEFVLAAEMTLAIMGEGGRAIGVGGAACGAMRCEAMRCDRGGRLVDGRAGVVDSKRPCLK